VPTSDTMNETRSEGYRSLSSLASAMNGTKCPVACAVPIAMCLLADAEGANMPRTTATPTRNTRATRIMVGGDAATAASNNAFDRG